MAGYSIWTFDLAATFVTDKKTGKVVKVTAPDAVLWQECPPDWGYTKAIERARDLEARNSTVFVVRHRGDDGNLSEIPHADWSRGRSMVLRRQNEVNAVQHQKRIAKKIRDSGYRPGGDA